MISDTRSNELDPADLLSEIWSRRYLIVGASAIFFVAAVIYSTIATPWYRSEALVGPVEENNQFNISSQLGGLASLAGISPSMGGAGDELVAVLESRDLAREFLNENKLIEPLAPADEISAGEGFLDVDLLAEIYAVDRFHSDVLSVRKNSQTGLISVSTEWTDPVSTKQWLDQFLVLANERMRREALTESEKNIEFLRESLKGAELVAIQQSIGSLLESEIQRFMLAKGSEAFSFRIIDSASQPKSPIKPQKLLIVAIWTFAGLLFSMSFVLGRFLWTRM